MKLIQKRSATCRSTYFLPRLTSKIFPYDNFETKFVINETFLSRMNDANAEKTEEKKSEIKEDVKIKEKIKRAS